VRRPLRDVPLGVNPIEVEIEYAETFLSPGHVDVQRGSDALVVQNQSLPPIIKCALEFALNGSLLNHHGRKLA